MLKYILLIAVFTNMAWSDYCDSDYNCSKKIDKKTRLYGLNCTLPSPTANMPIIAKDVFEADRKTLKTYFGTGETVCNVLGWMNFGAGNFSRLYVARLCKNA